MSLHRVSVWAATSSSTASLMLLQSAFNAVSVDAVQLMCAEGAACAGLCAPVSSTDRQEGNPSDGSGRL